jgi:hypothetical protein
VLEKDFQDTKMVSAHRRSCAYRFAVREAGQDYPGSGSIPDNSCSAKTEPAGYGDPGPFLSGLPFEHHSLALVQQRSSRLVVCN